MACFEEVSGLMESTRIDAADSVQVWHRWQEPFSSESIWPLQKIKVALDLEAICWLLHLCKAILLRWIKPEVCTWLISWSSKASWFEERLLLVASCLLRNRWLMFSSCSNKWSWSVPVHELPLLSYMLIELVLLVVMHPRLCRCWQVWRCLLPLIPWVASSCACAFAVGLDVGTEGWRPQELGIAVPTDVRSFTLVTFLVLHQIVEGGEAVVAICEVTFEWLLPVVDTHVSKQVTLLSECL